MALKKSEEQYLKQFRLVHGDKYSYEKFPEPFNQHTKITIICPIHGKFQQTICNHYNNKNGCPKCGKINMSKTKILTNKKRQDYIDDITSYYLNDFDFSMSNFNVGYDDKILVKCKICGNEQEKKLSSFLRKEAGCQICRIPKMQKTFYQKLRDIGKESFLKKANEIYGNKYDYSQIEYKGNSVPVKIICPIHGIFFKRPINHIYGLEGCSSCSAEAKYSSFETLTSQYLKNEKIVFINQYRILSDNYLKNKPFDFYLPELNTLIEIDGPQHRELCWNMTEEDLKQRKETDRLKTEYATKLGFKVIRIPTNLNIIYILKETIAELNQQLNDYQDEQIQVNRNKKIPDKE